VARAVHTPRSRPEPWHFAGPSGGGRVGRAHDWLRRTVIGRSLDQGRIGIIACATMRLPDTAPRREMPGAFGAGRRFSQRPSRPEASPDGCLSLAGM
jgi:hypothetical protein